MSVESRYDDLKRLIRDVPDFPKPGIIFKDITPLLRDAAAFRRVVDALADVVERERLRPDVCAAPEARGFIFASALAQRLHLGLVPIRKPGKLPARTARLDYALEYGNDAVEIHVDAVEPAQRVLIVDDVLATGGTIRACADLVAQRGAVIAGLLFVVELAFLGGRERLPEHAAHSILKY
jgi:adenine phosphoribosyltransferase